MQVRVLLEEEEEEEGWVISGLERSRGEDRWSSSEEGWFSLMGSVRWFLVFFSLFYFLVWEAVAFAQKDGIFVWFVRRGIGFVGFDSF